MATILVIVVTVQIALDTAYWTIINHITIWGSLAFYFILQYFYNFVIGGSYAGSLTKAMSEATFWFTLVLSIVILMIPVVAWRFYFVDVQPTLSDRVRLKQRLSAIRYVKNDSMTIGSNVFIHLFPFLTVRTSRRTLCGHLRLDAAGDPFVPATLSLTRKVSASSSLPGKSCEKRDSTLVEVPAGANRPATTMEAAEEAEAEATTEAAPALSLAAAMRPLASTILTVRHLSLYAVVADDYRIAAALLSLFLDPQNNIVPQVFLVKVFDETKAGAIFAETFPPTE